MLLDDAIAQFLADRTLKRRSAATIARYRAALTAWHRWRHARQHPADLTDLTLAELRQYLLYLLLEHVPHGGNPCRPPVACVGLSPNAVRSSRNIIRALLLFLVEQGDLPPAWRDQLRSSRLPAPDVELQDRAYWDAATVAALCRAARDDLAPEPAARTVAIVRLIHESGLRLDEVCRLVDADLDRDQGRARIIGKGRKRRWVYWGDGAALALDRYLAIRRGPSGGPVFRGTNHKNDGGALPPGAVRQVIKRLARKAGVALPTNAPIHAGRHGFAHLMIDGGAAISEVADLMGHSDIRTTMRYLHEKPEKLQQAHARALRRARGPVGEESEDS